MSASQPPGVRASGPAGRLAGAFLHSKLTPLTIVASLFLGLFAFATLPREEEPQIRVPMVDVGLRWSGVSAEQVERQLTSPVERRLWEIPKLEYLYSTSRDDGALVIARFQVGTDPDVALAQIRTRLDHAAPELPRGAAIAWVAPRGIDDVPILTLALTSPKRRDWDQNDLRLVAAELAGPLREVPGVARVRLLGGSPREIAIRPDPARMASAGVSVDQLLAAVAANGAASPAGTLVASNRGADIRVEGAYRTADDLRALLVPTRRGASVRLSELAVVADGPGETEAYVFHSEKGHPREPAVTIEVTKRPGVNATTLTQALRARVDALRPTLLGRDVEVAVTRDYGATAKHKSDDLIFHLLLATLSVVALIALALGRREAVIVAIAIPVTLALTLFVYRALGYTLNRVTLFALIFSIGILVDDAIVVVENITRHFRMKDARGVDERAVEAVDEVGNPTVLATVTVIAAILPLAFVGGLMGPYMKPIPVGASLAMIFSLAVAFVITPWAARRLLSVPKEGAAAKGHGEHGTEGPLDRRYRVWMNRLLGDGRFRLRFFAVMGALWLGAVSLVVFRVVTVKMLPFDNKSEFEVLLDLPPGAPLERTLAAAQAVADRLEHDPDVEAIQIYAGLGAPVTFNGLVRHYDFRGEPRFAEIQVELVHAGGRREQSHAIARRVRPALEAVAAPFGARLKVVEVPPGPPVLSTLVAEIYGPDLEGQRRVARDVWKVFRETPGVVDTDLLLTEGQPVRRFRIDRERAALAGSSSQAVADAAASLVAGAPVAVLDAPSQAEPVLVRTRLASADRADASALAALRVGTGNGTPLSELAVASADTASLEIHHKNLRRVVYVLGDVAGRAESPVYAISDLRPRVQALAMPNGAPIHQTSTAAPEDANRYGLKWDGEWHITYEVFRDMGAAFAVVLVLIYVLTVGWFRSFTTPFVIMLPIPLSLVGILPAHALTGAFFTATSMIGFIAGAGITVRNSIILVDFIELRRTQGLSLKEAVVDAGAVRFRPMVLTAAAVAVGASVILFDPIFQGLAIALIGGEIAATALSRMAVPVLYYLLHRRTEVPA
ncbi:MAG TPA: efflux RND transporter permease subunit [Candidatus Eisenbacteria bacterium]|nr:efflux RND transporter permease subunit [Candidatus Eisenbacteria bacterium]